LENAARSRYDGCQMEVNRRFTKNLSYGFAYTYSRSVDNASNPSETVYNAYDDRSFWGPSSFDTRHAAVFNVIYELPSPRSLLSNAGRLLGGWRITAVAQFQTGNPGTIGSTDDYAGIGSFDRLPWEMRGDPVLPRGERRFSESSNDQNFYFR